MKLDAHDVVHRWLAAVNAGNIPGVMALSAGDIEVGGPLGSGRGQPLLRAWIERTRLRMTTRRAFANGGRVVLLQDVAWRDERGMPIAEAVVANRFLVAEGRVAIVARYDRLEDALRDAELTTDDELQLT